MENGLFFDCTIILWRLPIYTYVQIFDRMKNSGAHKNTKNTTPNSPFHAVSLTEKWRSSWKTEYFRMSTESPECRPHVGTIRSDAGPREEKLFNKQISLVQKGFLCDSLSLCKVTKHHRKRNPFRLNSDLQRLVYPMEAGRSWSDFFKWTWKSLKVQASKEN